MRNGFPLWLATALSVVWMLPACFNVDEPDDPRDTEDDSGAATDADTDGDSDGDGVPDPLYRWHTFYGALSSDTGTSIAVDGDGNLYISGWSWATWDGPNGENPLHAHSGDFGDGHEYEDLFVLKLAP